MRDYRRNSHCVFDVKIHLVWITKYRKPVLVGEEGLKVRDMIRKICSDLEVDILAGNVRKDHIHLLLSYPSQLCISKWVHKIKEVTSCNLLQSSNRLRKKFWGRHLWAKGYFAVSTGSVTDEMIAEYIKNQDEVEKRKADNFLVGF